MPIGPGGVPVGPAGSGTAGAPPGWPTPDLNGLAGRALVSSWPQFAGSPPTPANASVTDSITTTVKVTPLDLFGNAQGLEEVQTSVGVVAYPALPELIESVTTRILVAQTPAPDPSDLASGRYRR